MEVSSTEEKSRFITTWILTDSKVDCIRPHYSNVQLFPLLFTKYLYIMSVMVYRHSAWLDQGFDYGPPWSSSFSSGQWNLRPKHFRRPGQSKERPGNRWWPSAAWEYIIDQGPAARLITLLYCHEPQWPETSGWPWPDRASRWPSP